MSDDVLILSPGEAGGGLNAIKAIMSVYEGDTVTFKYGWGDPPGTTSCTLNARNPCVTVTSDHGQQFNINDISGAKVRAVFDQPSNA